VLSEARESGFIKGLYGFNSFASHGQWSHIFVPQQTFRVCATDSVSERNRFLVVTEMGNSLCISL
jgi:hypothetical protein